MNLKLLLSISIIFFFISGNAQNKKEGEWRKLFNDTDLSGWKILNGQADFEVEDGVIIGTSVYGEKSSFLTTNEEYGDFILELELLVDPTINSGIQFRSHSIKDYQEGRVHGYQMEIDPSDRAYSGGIYDEGRRGWLYPLDLNEKAKQAFKNNEWNHYRIECIGNTIRTWVNGVSSAYLVDDLTLSGFIALQVHAIYEKADEGKQIRFRNIKIQTENLQPSAPDETFVLNLIPNHLSHQERSQGYRLLWDGKTTDGWRGVNESDFPAQDWLVKDGVLRAVATEAESKSGASLITVETFSSFELKFDFKLSKGADSGVEYFVDEPVDEGIGTAFGLEYQILDDANHPDAKLGRDGNRTLASLYDLIAAQRAPYSTRSVGDWNQGVIRVSPDNLVEYWFNGYKVLEFKRKSPEYLGLVALSKYKDLPDFGMASSGRILLQNKEKEVSFRSIKIKEL